MIDLQNIPVELIEPGRRLRELDDGHIKSLQASILDVGLLNPITVYERKVIQAGISVDGYGLVAGGHRLAAYKAIGYDEIPACIVDLSDLERQIAECDENLCGPKLSASEEARFIKRRKDAYEALHPETKHGTPRVSRQIGDSKTRSKNNAVDRFTADTAAKTGQSERAVQRAAERGEKVMDEALSIVRGTRLDTGVYLDKLKKLSPNDQVAAAKRDLANEKRRTEEPRTRGGLAARYQQAAPDPAKSAERFVSLVDQIEAIPVEELLSSGRMRATVGQRASGLADHLSEIVERLDR